MKIVVITCSPQPDYVRARVLRAALRQRPNVEVIVVKNSQRGVRRYVEVFQKILQAKKSVRPDVWLLTFRGYEMLPILLWLAGKTPVIFDELINAVEWIIDEHRKLQPNSWAARFLNWWYGRQLQRCYKILADTDAHARYSSERSHVGIEKYLTVPVGTDETVFQPPKQKNAVAKNISAPNSRIHYNVYSQAAAKNSQALYGPEHQRPDAENFQVSYGRRQENAEHFQVFYYGSMLPLHGLEIVLKAALSLKDADAITFLLVGGDKKTAQLVRRAQQAGARIEYRAWVPFEKLPALVAESALCLAGPFGNTIQAQLVVTGKAYQFLACAAPTVIGQNQATGEFRDKANCLLVPQGNAEALALAIRWAAAHPQELAVIAKNGRALFEQKYSTRVIASKLGSALPPL